MAALRTIELQTVSNVDRLYIPRVLVGRDLSCVWNCLDKEVLRVSKYIADALKDFQKQLRKS